MKARIIGVVVCVLLLPCLAWPATRTVAKSGTPDFSTIQAAIDFFRTSDPDPGVADTIDITDAAVYDEQITVDTPVTIQGNAVSRPVICAQLSGVSAGDGIFISIATGTANDVTLKNLIVLPSRTSPPTDDVIMSTGQNLNILLDNVLVAPNNGSDAPVSTDGMTEVNLDPPVQRIGDDCAFLGSGAAPVGDGTTVTLRNTVLTHAISATATPGVTGNDALVCSSTNTGGYRIEDGCVFSFCNRLGIQANGAAGTFFEVNAPTNRVLVLGNKGFAGIWFAGSSGGVQRDLKGINVIGNGFPYGGGWGIEQQWSSPVGITIEDAIIAGNSGPGLNIGSAGSPGPVTLNRVTIADNGTSHILVDAAYTAPINLTDCIVGGNGSSDGETNVVVHNGTGTMSLTGCGVILSPTSPMQLAGTGFVGTGTVNIVSAVYENPLFLETADYQSANYYDVQNNNFGTASATSGPLGGGGDYVGGLSRVQDYSLY